MSIRFRKGIADLCAEFGLKSPKKTEDLLRLCEHIIYQGALEFTEENVESTRLNATVRQIGEDSSGYIEITNIIKGGR